MSVRCYVYDNAVICAYEDGMLELMIDCGLFRSVNIDAKNYR